MATAYIHHPDCLRHEMSSGHPEAPARLMAIERLLNTQPWSDQLLRFEAPLATHEQLNRVHGLRYIQAVENASPLQGLRHLDPDTAMNPHTLTAALRAAGAAVVGTDLVIGGVAENAFCAVRPPGHHAERARAMGFCFFNNVAVAVGHALGQYGLSKVAIIDFDVHHGNGTEDIFSEDDRVLMLSIFQHPFYPGSGIGGRSDRMVNIPLRADSGGLELRTVVEGDWQAALEQFMPEMLFVSAGFDAHCDDAMAGLNLIDDDYRWLSRWIKTAARQWTGGRVVSVLEGGYEPAMLARNVVNHIAVLAGLDGED